jgi:tetratricopeptide (TPR) repeat protein
MALESDFCMPRLLRQWAQERTTGTLIVTALPPADVVSTVLVEDGAVVFATRRSRKDPTGELFLELFQVPEFTAENAEEIELIENQVLRVVNDLFNWSTADVQYSDGISLSSWPQLEMPVPDLMLQGMRGVVDTTRLREWIGDLECAYVRSSDPFSLFIVPLEPDEAFLLSRFDEPHRLADLLTVGGIAEDRALRLIAAYQFAGAIEPIAERPAVCQNLGAEPDAEPVTPLDVNEAAKFWYMIEDKLAAVDAGADYYAMLGVERRASNEVIVAQYRELARTFHPDRYRHFAPNHVDMDTRLDAIFSAMTTAYSVLTNPIHRDHYDRELSRLEHGRGLRVAEVTNPGGRTGPIPLRAIPMPVSDEEAPPAPPATPRVNDVPPPVAAPSLEQTVTGSLSAVDLFKHGQQFAARGDHTRAVAAYERAARLAPDNVWLCIALGTSLGYLPGRGRQAEDSLLKAVALAPFTIRPYVALAQLYRRAGRFDEARAQIKHALALKPDDKPAREELAELDKVDKGFGSGLLKKILGT